MPPPPKNIWPEMSPTSTSSSPSTTLEPKQNHHLLDSKNRADQEDYKHLAPLLLETAITQKTGPKPRNNNSSSKKKKNIHKTKDNGLLDALPPTPALPIVCNDPSESPQEDPLNIDQQAPSSALTLDASTTSTKGTLQIPSAQPSSKKMKTSNHRRNVSVASSISTMNSSTGMCIIDDYIERLLEAGYSKPKGERSSKPRLCLTIVEISTICHVAMDIFLQQPTLLELSPPVKIVGDTHGQYSDLIRLFQMSGLPPSSNYLFLGDYVDRGKQSLETMLLLLCYKIKYPETFFLLRGNHENQNVTRVYGFYDECKRRLSVKTWRLFIDVFNTLPIAALVGEKIFCVHGGLSPSLNSMDDIRRIERPVDVPDYGLLNDLLWSDPTNETSDYQPSDRGVSFCFGHNAIDDFLARFDLDLICRAHMVVEGGYEFFHNRTLVTVFSAPNYCGEFDNLGAVMSVDKDLMCSFQLLTPANHPLCKRQVPRTISTTHRQDEAILDNTLL